MAPDIFKTKKFKLLQDKWMRKLKQSGFEDIETSDGGIKAPTDPRTIAFAMRDKEEREAYYSMAQDFLNSYAFFDDLELNVWEMHCEGIGYKTIARKLKVTPYRVEITLTKLKKLARLA